GVASPVGPYGDGNRCRVRRPSGRVCRDLRGRDHRRGRRTAVHGTTDLPAAPALTVLALTVLALTVLALGALQSRVVAPATYAAVREQCWRWWPGHTVGGLPRRGRRHRLRHSG